METVIEVERERRESVYVCKLLIPPGSIIPHKSR